MASERNFVTPDGGLHFPLRVSRTPEIVAAAYLGYPLLIGDASVEVFTPAGRRMCSAASVKQARLLIRAYRRTT